jgi:hypothetical protein
MVLPSQGSRLRVQIQPIARDSPPEPDMASDVNPKPTKAGPAAPAAGRVRLGDAPVWIVAAVFAGLAWRQLEFVNTHAVNMMYGDQWDLYQPMFLGQGWWETYALQHGPHREGIGLLLTRALASASGWDSRWEAFAASILLIGAAALAVRLARLFGVARHSLLLAAVPLLFLNVHQYETFAGPVNLSYGSVPVLLLIAYCLCWFLSGSLWRLLAMGALTFLLIFSGFGLFAGLLTPAILAVEAVQAWRARERAHAAAAIMAIAITAGGWALFAWGYIFQPSAPGFRFPYEHPLEYFVFVGRMLGNFFGAAVMTRWEVCVGLAAAAGLAAISVGNAARCVSRGVAREPRSAVLFCLSTFTLLFCANCAVGRVFTSPIAPLAPRYATLLIPGGLAIYLQLEVLASGVASSWLAIAYTVLLVPATAAPRADEVNGANWFAEGRRSWKAAYLQTHDEAAADRIAHFIVYPLPLGPRLRYLEDRRLNLFEGLPSP